MIVDFVNRSHLEGELIILQGVGLLILIILFLLRADTSRVAWAASLAAMHSIIIHKSRALFGITLPDRSDDTFALDLNTCT